MCLADARTCDGQGGPVSAQGCVSFYSRFRLIFPILTKACTLLVFVVFPLSGVVNKPPDLWVMQVADCFFRADGRPDQDCCWMEDHFQELGSTCSPL